MAAVPAAGRPGYLIAVGQLLFTVGDAYSFYHEWVLGLEVPFPSIADGFYLLFYPLLAAGLLLLVRARTPRRDRQPDRRHHHRDRVGLLSWAS